MNAPPPLVDPAPKRTNRGATAKSKLGEHLLRAGLITSADLEQALAMHASKGIRLGEALVELGVVEPDQLLPFLRHQMQVPAARLREGLVDPHIVKLLPRSKAESLCSIALFKVRETLTVAMAQPLNLELVDELERITGLKVRPVVALQADIRRMIDRCYQDGFEVDAVTADLDENAVALEDDALHFDLNSLQALAEESPIINLVNYFILHAIRQRASDIHIEPGHKQSSVRFRVDGQLREVLRPRKEFHAAIVSRVKVMARMDVAEHRLPQDGRMHVVVEGREIDLRASTLPTVLGEKAVLRVLDRKNVTMHLDQLGLPEDSLGQIKQMLARPYGLVLVTGPTGSGKTTTLYCALELIKSVHSNIVTVEDPVEYQIEQINQVQVDNATSLTFPNALRSILRQDPDVIMIGEIRDAQTAEVAIQAALTGHLVMSTLHTNDSAGAVTRLLDMGVAGYKIAAALVGVVAQRLVRTICPKCRTYHYPPSEILHAIHYAGDNRRQFARGEGCSECFDTGFRGRQGIYEVLTCTPELRDLISETPNVGLIRQWYRAQGGRTLLEQGIRLAEAERTSLDEVMRVAFFE